MKSATLVKPSTKLRKENRIKTVHHSLAIEGNTLTEKQITAIIEKKNVLGPPKQIQEVVNAVYLYERISDLNPLSEKDLLRAHSQLMKELVARPGHYRNTNVGIIKGKKVGHVAPQSKKLPKLMRDLFKFLKAKDEVPFLIKACVFHYELEFIHPFEDGNGRMGRLWQQLLLIKHSPIFEYVSVESLIHKEHQRYYKVLEACDMVGESTIFVEFSLELIFKVLQEFNGQYRPEKISGTTRIELALNKFNGNDFTRKDYMNLHKGISTATASRDLALAVEGGLMVKKGDKSLASYKALKSNPPEVDFS